MTIFYPKTMQQKFVTYSPDLFEHFSDPDEDEDDFEENVANSTFDTTNEIVHSDISKKFEKSLDIVKIFDRRRKIRKHGCKYLALIGPSSLHNLYEI